MEEDQSGREGWIEYESKGGIQGSAGEGEGAGGEGEGGEGEGGEGGEGEGGEGEWVSGREGVSNNKLLFINC